MRSEVKLSPEQQAVVGAEDPEIAVVASAGSGKTLVLVERYLRHVLDEKISPDRILTITFTRKAAAEMKMRIVNGLRAAGALDQAQIAETGPIQTIHSLCEQLLRECALHAEVDAEFEILSESQSTRLQMEAIDEALALVDPAHREAEKLIAKLAGKRSFSHPQSPYARLRLSIRDAMKHLREAGTWEDVESLPYSDPERFRETWITALLGAQPEAVRQHSQEGDGKDWRQNLKAAWKAAARPTPPWLRSLPDAEDDRRCEFETCGVVQFALEAWRGLEQQMALRQQFDFTALEDRTVRLLENPEFKSGISQRFEILMVDEAQDLNPKQHALIELLTTGQRLTVGDDKQSIYGFRLADPGHFKTRYKIGARRLSRNYRSEPGVLNFIDHVFTTLWRDDYEPMQEPEPFDLNKISSPNFDGVESWEMGKQGSPTCACFIHALIQEGNRPQDICVLTRNTAACQVVQEALSRVGVASRILGGAEKFYARMEVRDLANILRCVADPSNDFSLLATLRGPAVQLSLEGIFKLGLHQPVVEALSDAELGPEDRRRIVAFLAWFEPVRSFADRVGAWEVLSRVLADSPFLEVLSARENGAKQVANVRKLLMLAAKDSALGPLEFADQIRDIQEFRHREGDADEFSDQVGVVRLMTIHKAKGLEFPIVVLPETNRKIAQKKREIVFDPELKLLATNFGGAPSLIHNFLSERIKEREIAEEMRVLYVAMTRAKSRLCVGIYPPSSEDTMSKRLRRALSDPIPPSVKVRRQPQVPRA